MNEYYYPYHEEHKGMEQSIFRHIYSSAKACPPALIQSLAHETIASNKRWIVAWSMVLHSNNRFAKVSQIVRLLIKCYVPNLVLKYPQRKKSHTVRSGERGGHGQSLCLLITRPGNCPRRYRIVALLVCEDAPSCCHHRVFLSMA